MRIRILYGYRGVASQNAFWPAGEYEVDDRKAAYLVDNGHAVGLVAPDAEPETLLDEVETESEPEAPRKKGRR